MPDNYTEKKDAKTVEELARLDDLKHMGPYLDHGFQDAVNHKRESLQSQELIECLYQTTGTYNDHDSAIINRTNSPVIYFPLSDAKRRNADAWITEIFLNGSNPPFTMKPTPVPDIAPEDSQKIAMDAIADYREMMTMQFMEQGYPPEMAEQLVFETPPDPDVLTQYVISRRDEMDNQRMEIASTKVDRMSTKCQDQMIEGNWMNAMRAVVDCCATYGTGILKGPIRRMRTVPRFNEKTGGMKIEEVERYEWEHISPLDAYPAKGAIEIGDGDFYQKVKYTAKELDGMRELGDGYFPHNITALCDKFPNGGLVLNLDIDSERKRLQNDGTARSYTDSMIEGIEFWGYMRGSMLINEMITEYDGKDIVESKYYEVNAIVIDKLLVFCAITDPKLGRNLFKGTFYRTQGSWWGDSPMKKMRDVQRSCNSALRSMCTNMAMASGPMGMIGDAKRIPASFDFKIKPWSFMTFNDPMHTGKPPVQLFQAASNSAEFRAMIDAFIKDADIVTGIPAYSHGSDIAAGAGRTASGLAMLMAAATRGLKSVVNSMSYDILVPAITYQYRVNLIHEDDPGIKGDAEVDVGGVLAILVKDQNIQRLNDFLEKINNPVIAGVMGQSGIAELLRKYVGLLEGVNPDNLIPSKSEMKKRESMEKINAQLQQAEQTGMGSQGAPQAQSQPKQMSGMDQSNGNSLASPEAPAPAPAPRPQPQPTTSGF